MLIFGLTANPGGVESFLLNYCRRMKPEKLQFDFLCNFPEPAAYEEELAGRGYRFFRVTPRNRNRRLFARELDALFREHAGEWNAVWVNVSSLANIDYLKAAAKYGIPKRIIHSHNSRNMDGFLRGLLHRCNRYRIGRYATDFWACSSDAAGWFFRKSLRSRAVIVHNAIDPERMRFDENKRKELRNRNGWDGRFVIGNIGRLHFQKNQGFLLDVFKEYRAAHPDALLVLVGQGEDGRKLEAKAKVLGIEDSVVFAGVQQDIQAYLSGFDLFLFPSLFEGLSVVGLEAQANGLPVLASREALQEEAVLNRNVLRLSLAAGPGEWSRGIEEMRARKREAYPAIRSAIIQKGFDIAVEAGKLERMLENNA